MRIITAAKHWKREQDEKVLWPVVISARRKRSDQARLALASIFYIWIFVLALTFFDHFFRGFCPAASGPLCSKQSFVVNLFTAMWHRLYACCCSSPSPAVARGSQYLKHLDFFQQRSESLFVFLVYKHMYWQSPLKNSPAASGPPACS